MKIVITLDVAPEYADPDHETGLTDDAWSLIFNRLYGIGDMIVITKDDFDQRVAEIDTAPGASVVGSPETSSEAARLIVPAAGSIRRRVLYQIWLRVDQKMSDEMLEREMRMKHQTLSSARNWLVQQGFLVDSRLRAESSSGRKVVLWTLTDDGRRIAAQLASEEHD